MKNSIQSIKERDKNIVNYITDVKKVKVDELCEIFHISPSTARIVLNRLAEEGKVIRTLGGAESIAVDTQISSTQDGRCSISNYKEKKSIAVAAAKFVDEGDVIAICGGSTTYLFAKEVANINNIVVVTNSIWVADSLCGNPTIEVHVSGGDLNHFKGSLTGPITERYFDNLRFDKVFIGVDSIDLECGVTNNDSSISFLERNILSKSKATYMLADFTKFVRTPNLEHIASFEEITGLITDYSTDAQLIELIRENGAKVFISEQA